MFFLTYLFYKVVATVIRALATRNPIISNPDEVYQIESRDPGRRIKVHIYRSASGPKPAAVLLNFHGSGFMIPLHGSDDEFCRRVNQESGYTVVDVQYRLAPEHPFPAALNDVEDVVNWARNRPEEFDLKRFAISGFSAGGNLALAAASSNLFPRETFDFRAVLAFYPVVDLFTDPGSKTPPDPTGKALPAALARIFNRCYIPNKYDARDPRISPYYAQPDRFPRRVLIITAAGDNLAGEAEELAAKIGQEADRQVICERMQDCNHSWDKFASPGTKQYDAKEKAYGMAISMLLSE